MSVFNPPTVKNAGARPLLYHNGEIAQLNVINWHGRSWACDPRQLGYNAATGNEAHLHVTGMGTPNRFWHSIHADKRGEGWVMGRFSGQPGNSKGRIKWTPLETSQVSPLLWGKVSSAAAYLGREVCQENIVACRADGLDVVTTHISGDQDRRLISINPNDWGTKHPGRKAMIEQLDQIDLTEINSTRLEGDKLILTSNICGSDGQPLTHTIDISWVPTDVRKAMYNPKDHDEKYSVRIIEPDPREDFECRGREQVATFYNEVNEQLDHEIVRVTRSNDFIFSVKVEFKPGLNDPNPRESVELTADSPEAIGRLESFKTLPEHVQAAVIKACWKTFEVANFNWSRVEKGGLRRRRFIQFYEYRTSRVRDALKGQAPLKDGESIVVMKVRSAATVVHLDDANGRKKGDEEVIPLNFDPTEGHPEQYRLMNFDPRPFAAYKTGFMSPIDTAIAPQHLIDPYVMGSEIMAAIWPKVDQLGFFGPFMLTAMAFPHGSEFTDFFNNPWYVRAFSSTSHSIFDAKRDAGRSYSLLGDQLFMKKMVGAAMVTGPNTDSASPVREGRLFPVRMPGQKMFFIKTAIPGWNIEVIEDALSSYMFMRMFGLATETTVLTLSAGGGLDNYQLALIVQRGQRWNAGKNIYLKDAWEGIYEDLFRGPNFYSPSSMYHRAADLVFRRNGAGEGAGLDTIDARNGLAAVRSQKAAKVSAASGQQAPAKLSIKPNQPLAKMFEYNEAREWLNVGTWYFDSGAKLISFSMVAIFASLMFAPLPVAGAVFFFACLATTVFSWPFWAVQMAKVGVAPRTILSMTPKHLFWGNISMHTTLKSGCDMERLGVGRFRISDRNLGNRIPMRDKRTAFLVGIVLPSAAGAALIGGALAISFGVSLVPLAMAALPILAGWRLSRFLDRWTSRLWYNGDQKSFWRAAIRFAGRNAPLFGGAAVSLIVLPHFAVFAIPLITAAMAGGWSLFMGYNIFNEFRIYHKEQKENYSRPEPNPTGIPRHQADTWRNTFKEIFGIKPPLFGKQEFTSNNDINVSPYRLRDAIQAQFPKLLDNVLVKDSALAKDFKNRETAITAGLQQAGYIDANGFPLIALDQPLPVLVDLIMKDARLNSLVDNKGNRLLATGSVARASIPDADFQFLPHLFNDPTAPTLVFKQAIADEDISRCPISDKTKTALKQAHEKDKKAIAKIIRDIKQNGKNPMGIINSLICGEKNRIIYLYSEFKSGTNQPPRRLRGLLRRAKIARLAKLTENEIQSMPRDSRLVGNLDALQYDRVQELNRLMIEEYFPQFAPRWKSGLLLFIEALESIRRRLA
ncbi:MAG: hypothetical protein WC632_02210 [Candidatus Margulisiibacteriota bacterium]